MVLALGMALALAPACRNTAEGVKEDVRLNTEEARDGAQTAGEDASGAARKIGADAKDAGSTIGQEAKQVGNAVADGAKEVGKAVADGAKDVAATVKEGAKEVASDVGGGKQTVDIKAALMAAKGIDASHIDVDTDANTKTLTLKGTVPTAAQRTAAERLARDKAEGYRIRNLLTVAKT
jgi:osmotically-inducible protein OsmY